MSENIGENLDSLMIGNASEGVSEATSEEIAARAAATAKKMKQLRKDEGAAKEVDKQLAKILPTLSFSMLNFVAKMIDFHIPSLTILSCISLGKKERTDLCQAQLSTVPKIPVKHPLPKTLFQQKHIQGNIDLWWEQILQANSLSKTHRFFDLRANKDFVELISQGLAEILRNFLENQGEHSFDKKALEKVLNKRGAEFFVE